MQFIPSRVICVAADDPENGWPQVRRDRRRIDNVLLKPFATAGDNSLVVQIAKRVDQACTQKRCAWRFIFFWLPAKQVKSWPQN